MVLAACIVLSAVGAGARAADTFEDVVVAGTAHEDGGARWTDSLTRASRDLCDEPGVERPMRLPLDRPKPKKDHADCIVNSVGVRNDSPRPIQCSGTISVINPSLTPPFPAKHPAVIYPGQESSVERVIARAQDVPSAFSSTCRIIPAELPPKPDVPEECTMSIRGPAAGDFYPPGSKRRDEQGTVAFEFSVDPSTRQAIDVWLVASSGYQDLDIAALKYSKHMRITTNCPQQRFRTNLQFKLSDGLPAQSPASN
jgi:TonB family protein